MLMKRVTKIIAVIWRTVTPTCRKVQVLWAHRLIVATMKVPNSAITVGIVHYVINHSLLQTIACILTVIITITMIITHLVNTPLPLHKP